MGGDLKTAWRLSFSDESALEVSCTWDALYKSTSLPFFYFYMPMRYDSVCTCIYRRNGAGMCERYGGDWTAERVRILRVEVAAGCCSPVLGHWWQRNDGRRDADRRRLLDPSYGSVLFIVVLLHSVTLLFVRCGNGSPNGYERCCCCCCWGILLLSDFQNTKTSSFRNRS